MGNGKGAFAHAQVSGSLTKPSSMTVISKGNDGLDFKASLSNALYRGDTFQTNSLRLLALVKY